MFLFLTEEILGITAVSDRGSYAKPLWLRCKRYHLTLTTLYYGFFFCAPPKFLSLRSRPGIEPTTRQPIVTLNPRRPPELRHNGEAHLKILWCSSYFLTIERNCSPQTLGYPHYLSTYFLQNLIKVSKDTNLAPHLPPVFSMIFANRLAGDITTGFGVVVVVVLLVVLLVLRARGTSNSCLGFGVVKYGGFDLRVYKYCWR